MLLVTLFSGEIRLNSVSVWSAVKCQEEVVFYSGRSRPSDGGEGGGGVVSKKFFSALQASVSSRNKAKVGGRGGGPSPGSATV